MATGIQITPESGITIGTTAITSGTDGRVLFQEGGVVQQDAAFFWDNTNKSLGVGAVPATNVRLDIRAQNTGTVLRVRRNDDTDNLFSISTTGTAVFKTTQFYNGIDLFNGAGSQIALRTYAGIGMIGVNGNGTINFTTTRASVGYGNHIGIGAALDVKADGALSTDIAFRVRNSGDTNNLFSINGVGYIDGNAVVSGTGDKNIFQTRASFNSASQGIGWRLDVTAGSAQYAHIEVDKTRITQYGDGKSGIFGYVSGTNGSSYFKGQVDTYNGIDYHYGNSGAAIGYYNILSAQAGPRLDSRFWSWSKKGESSQPLNAGVVTISGIAELMRLECKGGNLLLGGNTFGTNSEKNIVMFNGVAPTTSIADSIQMYSADIVAGNAAPHFRTENGSIIKLYQQSSAGITTVADLVTVLQNLGLLS